MQILHFNSIIKIVKQDFSLNDCYQFVRCFRVYNVGFTTEEDNFNRKLIEESFMRFKDLFIKIQKPNIRLCNKYQMWAEKYPQKTFLIKTLDNFKNKTNIMESYSEIFTSQGKELLKNLRPKLTKSENTDCKLTIKEVT